MKSVTNLAMLAALACAGPAMAATQPVTLKSLAAQVQKLEDQQAIYKLVVTDYATALDLMDMNAYAKLFTDDGVLSLGGIVFRGHEQIRDMFKHDPNALPPSLPLPRGVLPMPPMEGPPRPRMVPHVITNVAYTITGNTAKGICYWEEIALVEGRPGIINMGHYEDELSKVNGQWKFAKRTIVRDVPIGTSVVPPAKTP